VFKHVLEKIPLARDQLNVAIDDLAPVFTVTAIQEAAQSGDPRERNKVAVIERELNVLIPYLEELASRGLAEAQRLGAISRDSAHRNSSSTVPSLLHFLGDLNGYLANPSGNEAGNHNGHRRNQDPQSHDA
jgi:hypothetical protein